MADNETIADIIAEMRFHGQQNIDAEKDKPEYGILTVEGRITQNYADRLDAAHKRERGDCAKLREALVKIRSEAYECDQGGEYLGEGPDPGFERIIKMCDAALGATEEEGGNNAD